MRDAIRQGIWLSMDIPNQRITMTGIKKLCCSFGAKEEWDQHIANLNSNSPTGSFTDVYPGMQDTVRRANLAGTPCQAGRNHERENDFNNNNHSTIGLVGTWEVNNRSTRIKFVQEGTRIRGYVYNLHKYEIEKRYQNNEMIVDVTRVNDRTYTGSFLYKWRQLNLTSSSGGKYLYYARWTTVRIEIFDTTAGAGTGLKYIIRNPSTNKDEPYWPSFKQ